MSIDSNTSGPVEKLALFRERTVKVHIIDSSKKLTPKLMGMLVECGKGIFTNGDEELKKGLQRVIDRGGKIFFVYASFKRSILGFCALEPRSNPDLAGITMSPYRHGIYFSNGVVREDKRAKGIYRELNRQRVGEVIHQKYPSLRLSTQNPRVELGLIKVLNEYVAKKFITSYSLVRESWRNANGKSVTNVRPKGSGVPSIDNAYKKLDYENGEVYMLIFTLKYP